MGGGPDRKTRLRRLSALALFVAAASSIIGWSSAELYQAAAHGHVFWLRSRAGWLSRRDSPELFWFDVCIDLLAIAVVVGSLVAALRWPRSWRATPPTSAREE